MGRSNYFWSLVPFPSKLEVVAKCVRHSHAKWLCPLKMPVPPREMDVVGAMVYPSNTKLLCFPETVKQSTEYKAAFRSVHGHPFHVFTVFTVFTGFHVFTFTKNTTVTNAASCNWACKIVWLLGRNSPIGPTHCTFHFSAWLFNGCVLAAMLLQTAEMLSWGVTCMAKVSASRSCLIV